MPALPLSALLSQSLVAFTIEVDNELERAMVESGRPESLSLVAWTNYLRFVPPDGVVVRDLRHQAMATPEQAASVLGCLERWRIVDLGPATSGTGELSRASSRRDGFGSGRGIRAGWVVSPTETGRALQALWPPLPGEIEARWRARFGDVVVEELRASLVDLLGAIGLRLPDGLPSGWLGGDAGAVAPADAGIGAELAGAPLSSLLSKTIYAFAVEFGRGSRLPIGLCENTLRVLDGEGVRPGDLARLTGLSREMADVDWVLRRFVTEEADPTGSRGKVVRLTPRGLEVQQAARRMVASTERGWVERFGEERIGRLRAALDALYAPDGRGRGPLAEAMVPPAGVRRDGAEQPALGRRRVAPAVRQRTRDLVAQTGAFVADPLGALPHYPVWDGNRGFGP